MGIIEMMKFDDSVNLTRGNWWMWSIGLFVVQIVVGIVLAIATLVAGDAAGYIQTAFTLVIVWMMLGVAVGRLRNRGYTELVEFALRIIIAPWALIECAFLEGKELAAEE
jgi:uncharacterized membrane protein YhaH (DUF805 family)